MTQFAPSGWRITAAVRSLFVSQNMAHEAILVAEWYGCGHSLRGRLYAFRPHAVTPHSCRHEENAA
jgi:hypothetical protein